MSDESNKAREKCMAEEIWLMYFNNYLYEHGVISEKDRNRMVGRIANRKPSTAGKEKKKEKSYER